MGVTIFYRGSLSNLDRVEDFEDRVLDLALELGGQARIWRSTNEDNPQRTVRGVILDLFPGQETTSLLVSPEGWLVGLIEIEEAEQGQLAEPPWCWVKTQFGPVEGHVALIELFSALKREFMPDLEVRDEGEYRETRDLANLSAKFKQVQTAIDSLADGLRRYGLSDEAAEDREILVARIERIAKLVHRTLSRPAEHPLVRCDDGESDSDAPGRELREDAFFKENRRRQERLHRAIEEHLARGDTHEEAFDAAMREETAAGLPDDPEAEPHDWAEELEVEADEPWKESLPEITDEGDEEDFVADRQRHPLLQRASDLMLRIYELLKQQKGVESSHRQVLLHGVGEMTGGLAQALAEYPSFSSDAEDSAALPEPDDPFVGLSVVQLKRALRGAAFALGALFPLRADGTLDEPAFVELRDTIQRIETDTFAELGRCRKRLAGE